MTSDPITSPADDEPQNRLREESPPLPKLAAPKPKAPARRQLQSFGLANFKAFGANEQTIPLRPITLVFGPNSGGKSSLLHFLLWMKDVVEGKGCDIYFPTAGGKSVDLGGFKQIKHGTDPAAKIETRFSLPIRGRDERMYVVDAVSTFSSCRPSRNYLAELHGEIQKNFSEVLLRHSLESLVNGKLYAVEKKVVFDTLQTLLADEYTDSTIERRLNDCQTDGEQFTTPVSELREKFSPKLKTAISRELDVFDEKPQEPVHFTEQELLCELQALGGAILSTLNLPATSQAEGHPRLERLELRCADRTILSAVETEPGKLSVKTLDTEWLATFAGADEVSKTSSDWDASLKRFSEYFGLDDMDSIVRWIPNDVWVNHPYGEVEDQSFLAMKLVLIGTRDQEGLLQKCRRAIGEVFANLIYLGPLRTYPPRGMDVASLPTKSDAEGLFAWRCLYENEDVRSGVNDWLRRQGPTSRYEVFTDDNVSLKRFREVLAAELHRKIDALRTNVTDALEYGDERLDRERRFDGIEKQGQALFDWDDRTAVSEAMLLAASLVTSESTGTIFLRDTQTGKQFSSKDVGVGISQIIPVLVHAKDSWESLIVVEQPELHIHPALQAELGDVFIESALKQGNTFLIETHSEHLILRLLRRIRETSSGTLEEGKTPLTPADIAVLYVEPGEGGSKIIEIPVGADGDFDRPWPNGFFVERAHELF